MSATNWPTIVKISNFKVKRHSLSLSADFKDSNVSLTLDYSDPLLLANKNVVEHGHPLNTALGHIKP